MYTINRILSSLVIASFAFSSAGVFAQAPSGDSPQKKSTLKEHAWDDFESPITTDAKYPLLIGAGITTMLLVFEDQIVDPAQEETVERKPLGSFSKFGDWGGKTLPNAIYAGGMLSYGLLQSNDEAKRNAAGMFQASLYSIAVTSALKYTVREQRPNSRNRDSFPSGHTTAAFSFASYVGCRHSLAWAVAAYSLAGFVGYSRINDDRHYLHDVTAGATIGAAYGIGVCLAENARNDSDANKQGLKWFAAPADGGAVAGITIRY